MNYIQKIKELRIMNKYTQKQIADILGVYQQDYYRYEKEINELPIRHLITLAEFYNVSLDYLTGHEIKESSKADNENNDNT